MAKKTLTAKKTYGVNGLLEYQAGLPVGSTYITLTFTGGQLTSYGIRPATYTTANPTLQRIIEDSELFRRGRITLISTEPC